VPAWETLFLNLHQTSAAELTRFATAVGYALEVMQAEGRPIEQLQQVIGKALLGLEGLSEEQSGQWLRVAWYILLLVFHRRDRAEYHRLQQQILQTTRGSKFSGSEEVGEMAQSMAQLIEERGIQIGQERGIQIGQEQGIQIGQLLALRNALLTVLTARFGELPPTVEASIQTASAESIEAWLAAAATAPTLDAVGILTPQ
jgi:hypothetical protein